MGRKIRLKTGKSSIFFVGTSSGKTSLNRFHSSLFIYSSNFNLLIDCGDGCSKALLSHNISPQDIDGILFSHLHPDHSAGFASLIVQMMQLKRKKKLKVFCHKKLTETVKLFLSRSFVFAERSTFKIEYEEFNHEEEINISNNLTITSKQNSHLDGYIDFLDEKKSGFSSSSFFLVLDDQKILYSADISSNEDLYLFEDDSPEIIITEAIHIEWEELIMFLKSVNPKKVIITHLSDELAIDLGHRIKNLPKPLNKKIIIAYDGLALKF